MVVGLSPSARAGNKNHIDCGLTEQNYPHIGDVNTKLSTTVPSVFGARVNRVVWKRGSG